MPQADEEEDSDEEADSGEETESNEETDASVRVVGVSEEKLIDEVYAVSLVVKRNIGIKTDINTRPVNSSLVRIAFFIAGLHSAVKPRHKSRF